VVCPGPAAAPRAARKGPASSAALLPRCAAPQEVTHCALEGFRGASICILLCYVTQSGDKNLRFRETAARLPAKERLFNATLTVQLPQSDFFTI